MKGQRGPRGLQGPAGVAGTSAQVIPGSGAPTVDPNPVTAYALYEDTAVDGHWWIWTPGTPGAWADTGARVSGANGADGLNAFTVTTAATTITPAGGFMLVTVPPGENALATPGQVVYIQTAGYFGVLNLVGTTQIALINLRNDTTGAYSSNAVSGTLVVGSQISPAGIQGPFGLSISVTSGSGVPVTDLNQQPGLYLRSGGNYYIWNIGGQSWTDTGISVTGPAGATGATGAAGHTPVVTTVTSNPTAAGGAAGDIRWYQPVGNNGFTTIYYNLAGTWTQGPTILANRLIGYSTTSILPNPAGVAANVGDQYWAYDGSDLYFFVCSVAGSPGTWATAMVLPISGGGGVGTFQQVSDASPVLAAGRRTGTRIWTMERSIQLYPQTVNITSLLTTTLDTAYQWQKISIQVVSFAIDWSPVSSNVNCEWIFEFTNNYAGQATIDYVNNRWSKSPGVTHPIILNPGEVATLHCYNIKGKMNIAFVEQNLTAI